MDTQPNVIIGFGNWFGRRISDTSPIALRNIRKFFLYLRRRRAKPLGLGQSQTSRFSFVLYKQAVTAEQSEWACLSAAIFGSYECFEQFWVSLKFVLINLNHFESRGIWIESLILRISPELFSRSWLLTHTDHKNDLDHPCPCSYCKILIFPSPFYESNSIHRSVFHTSPLPNPLYRISF